MTIVWSGLSIGCLYATLAVLLNVTMAQSSIFNFAAPQTAMAGAFTTYVLHDQHHWPFPAVIVAAVLVGALLGAAVELVAIRPLGRGWYSGHGPLVTTVGAAFLISGIAFVVWGSVPRRASFIFADPVHTWLGGRVSTLDIVQMIVAVVLVVVMHLVSRRTRWGLFGRAATTDPDAAALRGINVSRGRSTAFAVAGGLGGLAGLMVGPTLYTGYDVGTILLVYAFVALAVGGIGSYPGCLLGGVVVGLVQALSDRYLATQYTLMVIFGLLLVTLVVRPTGALGTRRLRLV